MFIKHGSPNYGLKKKNKNCMRLNSDPEALLWQPWYKQGFQSLADGLSADLPLLWRGFSKRDLLTGFLPAAHVSACRSVKWRETPALGLGSCASAFWVPAPLPIPSQNPDL